jgi:antitoxin (DNA-binding transcriptional repressor) of toxin-antitoxin stability system
MRAIGIRELKNKLSHYVRLVEAGESVLVTHRGTVVAELRPPGPTTVPPAPTQGLERLVRERRASPGAEHDPSLYAARPRAVQPGAVRALLDAERASS